MICWPRVLGTVLFANSKQTSSSLLCDYVDGTADGDNVR